MRRSLFWTSWVLAALYLVALTIFAVGRYGLFGAQPDPLAGIFLVPLGLPWSLLTGWLPITLQPYAAILAPLINVFILRWLGRTPAAGR